MATSDELLIKKEIDISAVLRGLGGMRSAVQPGALAKVYAAVEGLRELPYPQGYLDGVRDELLFMLTGRGNEPKPVASVYLAFYGHGRHANYLKIGIASDVRGRLASHTTSNPVPMLWAWTAGFNARPDAYGIESALLKHMSPDKLHGEWVSVGGFSEQATGALVESLAEVATASHGQLVRFRRWVC
jgi:hypothetical protein